MSASGLTTHRFSIEELLDLRKSLPIIRCVVNNLNKTDGPSVLRIPEEAWHDPDNFFCKTRALAEIFNKHMIGSIVRKPKSESSQESEYQSGTITNVNNHPAQPQIHWNLRRRESTDNSSEPHSAPSGIAAQKAENFQKFYRAVISPTHIRVTAGGRIVPNNRSTGPLGTERNDNSQSTDNIALEPAPLNLQPRSWPFPQQLLTSFPTPVPRGIWSQSNLAQHGNSLVFPQLAPHLQACPSEKFSSTGRFQSPNLNRNLSFGRQRTTLPEGIKISHPSQFDQTKPFMINGHVVYPVQPGFHPPPYAFPMPIGMIGNPNFIPQNQPSVFQKHYFAGSPGNLINHPVFPNVPLQSINPPYPGLSSDHLAPPSFAPATGIPIISLEFLTSQLQNLYNNLNSIEKQIAEKNSHFDESFLEAQRNLIHSQINSTQIAISNQVSRQINKNQEFDLKEVKLQSTTVPVNITDEHKTSNQQKSFRSTSTKGLGPEEQNSTIAENYADRSAQLKSPVKSRLSMSSAKAPPFQPRPQTGMNISSTTNSTQKKQAEDFTKRAVSTGKASHFSASPQHISTIPNEYSTLDRPLVTSATQFEHNNSLQSGIFESVAPQLKKHNTSINSIDHKINPPKSLGAPYLVGSLPSGLNCNPNLPANIVYARPLTDGEIRARYLYFGKAPRSIQSGLPKFDGKDFYPPSPSKSVEKFDSSKSDSGTVAEHTYTTPIPPRFVTPGPIRYRHSVQNLHHFSQSLDLSIDNKNSQFSHDSSSDQGESTKQHKNSRNLKSSSNEINETDDFARLYMNRNTYRLNSLPQRHASENVDRGEKFSSFFTEQKKSSNRNSLTKRQNSSSMTSDGQRNLPAIPPDPNTEEDHLNLKKHETYKHSTCDEQAIHDFHSGSSISGVTGDHSTDSTVEIRLSPGLKATSTKLAEKVFSGRAESSQSPDKHTLFLQNMLRNTPQVPLVGSALSGSITSATARGYLPQYRGSALASLAPTKPPPHVTNFSDRGAECSENIKPKMHPTSSLSPTIALSGKKENLPFKSDET